MEASRIFLKVANALVSFIVIAALLVVGLYSIYALWDNHRIYQATENVQADMLQFKPDADRPSMDELLAINPDVCAWISLDNTNIDYPVLQGETNLTYINTDIYGNFALAGSLFLDTRCNKNFQDSYSLLYGHHMADSKMFGDLDLYKEKDFFSKNKTGFLIATNKAYNLEIFACLVVSASDSMVFEPGRWQGNIDSLLDYTQQNALQLHEDVLAKAREANSPQVLALSTCSSEYTDARTIILAVMKPYGSAE